MNPLTRLIFAFGLGLLAVSPPAEPSQVNLPAIRNLAATLADPASRTDALLTIVALSRLQQVYPELSPDALADLETAVRNDRAWLSHLATRFPATPSRSTIFDPAAWFIQQELEQQALEPGPQVSPLGPEYSDLLSPLFDRTDERLAAAFLPEVLFQAEFISTSLWQQLLNQAKTDAALMALLTQLNADWFDPWLAAEPPAPLPAARHMDALGQALVDQQALLASVLLPEPPDELQVRRLRFNVLRGLPGMDTRQSRTARQVLCLTSALSGLYEHRYLEFIESLLWVVTDLFEAGMSYPDLESPLPQVLAEFLPQLSNVMARDFAEVDVRFNGNLAKGFEISQEIGAGKLTRNRTAELRQMLADGVSELVMLVPDMAFYFDQPVRGQISQEIDVCISIAALRDENGHPAMGREQFDACMESLAQLADTVVRRTELAGDPDGPFGPDQLKRELEMTPWQRINYAVGYLHERSPKVCPLPVRALPNPLEWSALATLMTWFSTQSPVFLQTPGNRALIVHMRQEGLDLLYTLSQQVECISGAGTEFDDLVSVSLRQYREALLDLLGGIHEMELVFRDEQLQAGADVVLAEGVSQETAYRPADLVIGPCDASRVCEMSQELEATRTLMGRFPDEYLLADQTRLGKVEICYDNMQWVERRSELVRREDPNIANYYGHLSFELMGRFREGESVIPVFSSGFTSPEEYHYLIAAARDEVLASGCPVEWIGTSIVTERTNAPGIKVVPNRLTYLAAARNRPSAIITANWSRGEEWRDRLATAGGVHEAGAHMDAGVTQRLERHLLALHQAEQQVIYSNLLRPAIRTEPSLVPSLFELMGDVTMYKELIRNQLNLFYPDFLLDSNRIRSALAGQSGLLDTDGVLHLQENGVAVAQIREIGLARLEDFQSMWTQQPEPVLRSGSVATSVAHALARLNSLYREYFATPPGVDADTAAPVQTETLPAETRQG